MVQAAATQLLLLGEDSEENFKTEFHFGLAVASFEFLVYAVRK